MMKIKLFDYQKMGRNFDVNLLPPNKVRPEIGKEEGTGGAPERNGSKRIF